MARIPAFPRGGARRTLIAASIAVLPFAVFAACATGEELHEGTGTDTGGAPSAGGAGTGGGKQGTGATASGGSSTSGGASGTGGAPGTGGVVATGAVTGSGGAEPSTGGAASSGGSSGSGGAATGGATATGGAATGGASTGGATGGSTSTGGAKATGGSTSTGGAKATGGSTSTGGAKATGGTAATGGATGCADTDADGITDCDENEDGSTWTDPAIFNGLHVQRGNQCSASGSCSENNTLQKVNACMQGNIAEEKDQRAGWDWNNPDDNVCDAGYGFAPNWTRCDSSWAARWNGCIHFETAGPHCFQITGSTDEGCAALYFNGNSGSADAQSGSAVKCFSVGAGNYPLMFHYTMDDGSSSSMHVRYCDAAGGTQCTPSAAIPSRMLRTTCP